ncbi:MAG: cupin domain-containing protein [Nocardioidaceae bacterium]
MHVIKKCDAPVFELPGVSFTALAAPSRGSHQICAWLLTVAPGLESAEAHSLDRDEVFLVLEGAIRLAPEGEVAVAGDAIVVPAGEPIRLSNAGQGAAKVHVAVSAGFAATMADGGPIGTPPWAA